MKVAEMFAINISSSEINELIKLNSRKQSMENLHQMLSSKESMFIVGNTPPTREYPLETSRSKAYFIMLIP